MRITALTVLFAITIAFTTSGAPGPREVRKPIDPPGGDWEVLKWELNGLMMKVSNAPPSEMIMRFTPNKFEMVDAGFPQDTKAAYFRDGEVFEIDLPHEDSTYLMRGIWKVDGDTLLLCLGRPGADRPTEFTAPKDSKRSLWTLKRKEKQ